MFSMLATCTWKESSGSSSAAHVRSIVWTSKPGSRRCSPQRAHRLRITHQGISTVIRAARWLTVENRVDGRFATRKPQAAKDHLVVLS